jgi:dephospho-CoA kinase
MLIIGLTGGIGSGKSTVARHFESLGVPVIDADIITRELVKPGQDALKEIVAHFGPDIIQTDGQLNRAWLRALIFDNPGERKVLENILHPRARESALRQLAKLDTPYCILCVPLLIESGWNDMVHRILVIDLPRELQIQRTMDRDGIPENQVETIINTQIDRDSRLSAADDVIVNTGDTTTLLEQVDSLHQKYLQLAKTARDTEQ